MSKFFCTLTIFAGCNGGSVALDHLYDVEGIRRNLREATEALRQKVY